VQQTVVISWPKREPATTQVHIYMTLAKVVVTYQASDKQVHTYWRHPGALI